MVSPSTAFLAVLEGRYSKGLSKAFLGRKTSCCNVPGKEGQRVFKYKIVDLVMGVSL